MKTEIFVFFESLNQNLTFHVHNVKFLSQEPLKKLSGSFSIIDIKLTIQAFSGEACDCMRLGMR